jgi:ferric-dicitrate binding protein FerR (iron transport regulator)
MTSKTDYSKLENFLKGKYSYNDYLQVQSWFKQLEKNEKVKEQLFIQWNGFLNDEPDADKSLLHIFEKIQYTILLEEKKQADSRFIWNSYRRVAAILLIPVLAFSVWYYSLTGEGSKEDSMSLNSQGWVEINAPEGARVEFLLPDSTSGWLNGGSKLKYSSVFTRHRNVQLSGEAYFEVNHLKKSDFVVSVFDMDVKVLGTKFDVSAYTDDSFTDVILKEGKVEINGKTGVFHQILSPDEKITFNRELKKITMCKVEADDFIAWKDGYLIIDDEPFGRVARKIERWYNAEIVIKDEKLKNYRFKATFKDEPLEEVLRLIAITTPIRYHIEKRTVDSNEVIKQKKVFIQMK